ncbi:MAG: folylpolyglutamate synthase/dihydrofolate synthase family protein [Granulosicoccaceae bacterium]
MQSPSHKASLDDWLAWLEELHPCDIDLGLERVSEVALRLDLTPAPMPVILVGGTNGKGSTVKLLTNAYQFAGHKTGTYTSPHIERFNERMSINGVDASDEQIVAALYVVEQGRGKTTLTYFEYTTLAAMLLFREQHCGVVILEVGLGGRLDATNLWDADCAIITSIALDHQTYLGDTRESIAREKVAIGRAQKPLIVGDPDPPSIMKELAVKTSMKWIQIPQFPELAVKLAGVHLRRNAACAVEAVAQLQTKLPVSDAALTRALSSDALPGRFQLLSAAGVLNLLDVAHNPAAAAALVATISEVFPATPVQLIFGVMADKDVEGVVSALQPIATNWFSTALPQPRALSSDVLAAKIKEVDPHAQVTICHDIGEAWQGAVAITRSDDASDSVRSLVVVVGSFYMLSALQEYWQASGIVVHPVSVDSVGA